MPDVSRRGFLSKSLKTVAAVTLIPIANKLKPPLTIIPEPKRTLNRDFIDGSSMVNGCPATGVTYGNDFTTFYRMTKNDLEKY